CLLVNVEPDVIHMFVEEPPWLFSESTSPLSSAFLYTTRSTYIQTFRQLPRRRIWARTTFRFARDTEAIQKLQFPMTPKGHETLYSEP
ncbi:MAG TPA: hypothetical protein VHZ55_19635, partial [Bryobacteraceae bacterium]|nr:hypothetical protein [Bryobacteraceae bacterium]